MRLVRRLLAVAMVLAVVSWMGVQPALASPGDIALFDEKANEYSIGRNTVAVVDGVLYALNSRRGLYFYKPGDAAAQQLMDFSREWFDGTQMIDESGKIRLPSDLSGEVATTGMFLRQLISGGDALYAFDNMFASIWKYDEAAKKFVKAYDIPKNAIVEFGSGDYGGIYCPTFIDGKIYYLYYAAGLETLIKRLDPITGVVEQVSDYRCMSFAPYRPGKLLVAQGNYGDMAVIGVLDLSTGQIEDKLALNAYASGGFANFSDMVYDAAADTFYVYRPGEVFRSVSFAAPESVAYLPVGILATNSAVMLPGGYYALATSDNVYVRNVDPQYKPADALLLNGFYHQETTRAFTAFRPDIPIKLDAQYSINEEDMARTLSQPDAANLYGLTLGSCDLGALYDKGCIADLSGDAKLMAEVSRMPRPCATR